jgi:hypothetical protein
MMFDKIGLNLLHIAWTERGHVYIVHSRLYVLCMCIFTVSNVNMYRIDKDQDK